MRVFSPVENFAHGLAAWLTGEGTSYSWRLSTMSTTPDGTALITVMDAEDKRITFAVFETDKASRRPI